MYPNFDVCPKLHGKTAKEKHGCPNYIDVMGKCFRYCDLTSKHTCGECVHWYGHETCKPNDRHSKYGSCPFVIGNVNSTFKVTCPHYHKRPDDFYWVFPDWVEDQVESTGIDPVSVEARKVRIAARNKWFDMWK